MIRDDGNNRDLNMIRIQIDDDPDPDLITADGSHLPVLAATFQTRPWSAS